MIKTPQGIELRNLQEQVQKNKEDIALHYQMDRVLANFGIRVIGEVATEEDLPDPDEFAGEYGDAYAVGTEEPYTFYIWTRANAQAGHPNDFWFSVGRLAIVGPQGPRGQQGETGEKGDPGQSIIVTGVNSINYLTPPAEHGFTPGTPVMLTTGEIYEVSNDGTYWVYMTNIKGHQGVQGIQGVPGPQGPQGPQGVKGDKGDVGGFIGIVGIVGSVSQLPTPTSLGDLTRAFLVGTSAPYDLYIQVGDSSSTAVWTDMGPLNIATYVSVNGEYVGLWDSDTKVDKITTADQHASARMYRINNDGSQVVSYLIGSPGTSEIGSHIGTNYSPIYYNGCLASRTPTQDYQVANKKYVDDHAAKYYMHTLYGVVGTDDAYFDGTIKIINKNSTPYLFNTYEHPSQATITLAELAKCVLCGGEVKSYGSTIYRGAFNILPGGKVEFMDEAGYHQLTIDFMSNLNGPMTDTVTEL